MWLSKIKKKKKQFVLIAVILIVTSFILSVCLNMTTQVTAYVQEYYKDIKDVILITTDVDQKDEMLKFVDEVEGEKSLKEAVGFNLNKNVYLEDENLNIPTGLIVVVEQIDNNPWDIIIVDSENDKAPGKNEIWVQKIMADNEQIKLGDNIRVKVNDSYKEFKVTAFLNDSLQPSSVVGYNNFFIGKDSEAELEELLKVNIVAYNYKESASQSIGDMKDYLNSPISGEIILKDTISSAAVTTSSIIGGIGVIASLIIFIVAIIIIRFILWNNILKEYRAIGIYKAIGFSSNKIRNIYIKAFGIIGVISIIVGSLLSVYLTNSFVKSIVKYIGVYTSGNSGIKVILATIIVMSSVLLINLFLLLRRVKTIKPVEALTIGTTSSIKKLPSSVIKDSIKPFSIAINDIWKYKMQNFIILIVLSLVAFLSLLFVNIDYSIANIDKNIPTWFGIMQGDINIDCNDKGDCYKQVLEEINNDDRIKGYKYGRYGIKDIITLETSRYNIKKDQMVYYAYNNYDDVDGFESSIVDGKNPANNKEVALSKNILKDSGLSIGDYIILQVDENEKKFLISGSFTSILNEGYSFRVLLDAIPEEKLNLLNNNISLTFNNKDDIEAFKVDFKEKYPAAIIEEIPKEITNGLIDLEIVAPITRILIIAISFFSLLNIINLIMINNSDNRRQYGIIKSLGFSSTYIIKRTVYRIALISSISMIIGIVTNHLLSRQIFKVAIMGIDGMNISNSLSIISIIGIYILIIVTTIVTMLPIRNISTVELMEE